MEWTKITTAMPAANVRLLVRGNVTKYITIKDRTMNLKVDFYSIITSLRYDIPSLNYIFNIEDVIDITGLDSERDHYSSPQLWKEFRIHKNYLPKLCHERKLKFRFTDIREWVIID